jgi:hypothetical protein
MEAVVSPKVVRATRESLERRRDELLGELGTSLPDFLELADSTVLTGEEFERLQELENIAFLLGDPLRAE